MAEPQSTTQRVRRRASRAAGPPKPEPDDRVAEATEAVEDATTVEDDGVAQTAAKASATPKPAAKKPTKPIKPIKPIKPQTKLRPPPRRPAHRVLVGWVSLAAAVVLIGLLTAAVVVLVGQHRDANARRARDQRFVDTATQAVVNMYSYTPDTVDESVNRWVNGASGPLRGMLSANNAIENLKALYRSTQATSEAVVTGAALEGIDAISANASVLVSVRVTVADVDGVNKPSAPYRLRVIVHEDESGKMTEYDLRYPNGGN